MASCGAPAVFTLKILGPPGPENVSLSEGCAELNVYIQETGAWEPPRTAKVSTGEIDQLLKDACAQQPPPPEDPPTTDGNILFNVWGPCRKSLNLKGPST